MRSLSEAAGEHVPPQGVRASAKRGLEMVKNGEAGGGLESATVARARKIAAGEALTDAHVKRMHSFFERHDKTRPDDGGSGKSPWRTAWMLWGGNAGRRWARSVANSLNEGWSLDLADLDIVADADENELLALHAKDRKRLLHEAKIAAFASKSLGAITPLIRRDDEEQPRWPKDSPGSKGGQFMRVGQRFAYKGKTYEISSIKDDGRVTAQLATGESKPDEVILSKDEAEQLYPAKPTEVQGTKGFTEAMRRGTVIVDPYVESSTHDSNLPIPEGWSEDEWQRFGEEDQRNFLYLMDRFGEWRSGDSERIIDHVKGYYSAKAIKTVTAALRQQYGSSSGSTLNLTDVFLGDLSEAMDNYEGAKLLLRDVAEVIQWDLYNQLRSPDIHLVHRTDVDNSDDWFDREIPVMSGLSFATGWEGDYEGGPEVLVVPLAIRHVEMHSASGGVYVDEGYLPELEATTGARMVVDPERSLALNEHTLPRLVRMYFNQEADYGPSSGEVVYNAIAAMKDPDYELPIGPQGPALSRVDSPSSIPETAVEAAREIAANADRAALGMVRRKLTYEEVKKAPVGTVGTLGETEWEKIGKSKWRMTGAASDVDTYFDQRIKAGDEVGAVAFADILNQAAGPGLMGSSIQFEIPPQAETLTGPELIDAGVKPGDVFGIVGAANSAYSVAVPSPGSPGGVQLQTYVLGKEIGPGPRSLSEFPDGKFVPFGHVDEPLYVNTAFQPMSRAQVDDLEPVADPVMLYKLEPNTLVRLESGLPGEPREGRVYRVLPGPGNPQAPGADNRVVAVQSVENGTIYRANAFHKTAPLGAVRGPGVTESDLPQLVARTGQEVIVTHQGKRRLARFVKATNPEADEPGAVVQFVNANGKLGKETNVSGASVQLLPESHAEPADWQVGDRFSKSGKQYTVTAIQEDGTIQAKPQSGKEQEFEPVSGDVREAGPLPARASKARLKERQETIKAFVDDLNEYPVGTNIEVLDPDGENFYAVKVRGKWETPGGQQVNLGSITDRLDFAADEAPNRTVRVVVPYDQPTFKEFDSKTHVRPGDWALYEKVKSRELKPGEMVSLSPVKERPARVLEVSKDKKTVKIHNLETGKVTSMSGGQSMWKLATRYSSDSEPFEVYNPFERLGDPGVTGVTPGFGEARTMPSEPTAFQATTNEAAPGSRLVNVSTGDAFVKNLNGSWSGVNSSHFFAPEALILGLHPAGQWEMQEPDFDLSEWMGKEITLDQVFAVPRGASVRVEGAPPDWAEAREEDIDVDFFKREFNGWRWQKDGKELFYSDKQWQARAAVGTKFTLDWVDDVVEPKDTVALPSGSRVSWGGSDFVFEKREDGSWYSPDAEQTMSPDEWNEWIDRTEFEYFTVRDQDKEWTTKSDFEDEPVGTVLSIVTFRGAQVGAMIGDADGLEPLPDGTIVKDKDGDNWRRVDGEWEQTTGAEGFDIEAYAPYAIQDVPLDVDQYNGTAGRFIRRADGVWAPWPEGETWSNSSGFVSEGMANQTAAYGLVYKKTGDVADRDVLLDLPEGSRVSGRSGGSEWLKVDADGWRQLDGRSGGFAGSETVDSDAVAEWDGEDGTFTILTRGSADATEEEIAAEVEAYDLGDTFGTTVEISNLTLDDRQKALDLAQPGSTATLVDTSDDGVEDAVFRKNENGTWEGPDGDSPSALLVQIGDRADSTLTLRAATDVGRDEGNIFDGVEDHVRFLDSMGMGSYFTIKDQQVVKADDSAGTWITLDGPISTPDLIERINAAGVKNVDLEVSSEAFNLSEENLNNLPVGTRLMKAAASYTGIVLPESAYVKEADGKWREPSSFSPPNAMPAEVVVSRFRNEKRFIQLPSESGPVSINAADVSTLDSMPLGTVVRDVDGDAWRKAVGGWHYKSQDSGGFSEFHVWPSGALAGAILSERKVLYVQGRARTSFAGGAVREGDTANGRMIEDAPAGATFRSKTNPEIRWVKLSKDEGMGWVGPGGWSGDRSVEPDEIAAFLNTGAYKVDTWPPTGQGAGVISYIEGSEIDADETFLYNAPSGTQITDANGTSYTKIEDQYWQDSDYEEYTSSAELVGLTAMLDELPGGKIEFSAVGPTVRLGDIGDVPEDVLLRNPRTNEEIVSDNEGDWSLRDGSAWIDLNDYDDNIEWIIVDWPGSTVLRLPEEGDEIVLTVAYTDAAPPGTALKTEGGNTWTKRGDGVWTSPTGTVEAADMADGAPHEVVFWPVPDEDMLVLVPGEKRPATFSLIDAAPVGTVLGLGTDRFRKLQNGDWATDVRTLSPEQMADERTHEVIEWPVDYGQVPANANQMQMDTGVYAVGDKIEEPTKEMVAAFPRGLQFKDRDNDLWTINALNEPEDVSGGTSLPSEVLKYAPFTIANVPPPSPPIGGEVTMENFPTLPAGAVLKDSSGDIWNIDDAGNVSLPGGQAGPFRPSLIDNYGPLLLAEYPGDMVAPGGSLPKPNPAAVIAKLNSSPEEAELSSEKYPGGVYVKYGDRWLWSGTDGDGDSSEKIVTNHVVDADGKIMNEGWLLRWPGRQGAWALSKIVGEDSVDSPSVATAPEAGDMVTSNEDMGDIVKGGFYRVIKVEVGVATLRVLDDGGKHQRGTLIAAPHIAMFSPGVPPALDPVQPSMLPNADTLQPYKNKTYGETTFERLRDLPPGSIFSDKTGKRWMLKIPGAAPVLTDGEGNYTYDPDALVRSETDSWSVSGSRTFGNKVDSAQELDLLPIGSQVRVGDQMWEKVDGGEIHGGDDSEIRWRVANTGASETINNAMLANLVEELGVVSLPKNKAPFLDNSPPLVRKVKASRLATSEELDSLPTNTMVRVESKDGTQIWQKTKWEKVTPAGSQAQWEQIYPGGEAEAEAQPSKVLMDNGLVYIQEAAHG